MNPMMLARFAREEVSRRVAEAQRMRVVRDAIASRPQFWKVVAWRCGDWMIRYGKFLQSMTSALKTETKETEAESVVA